MLETLLHTKPKRKLLSLFFAFPKRSFTLQELQKTIEVSATVASETIRELARAEVVNIALKNRQRLFRVNPRFPLYQELSDLLQDEIREREDIVSRFFRKLNNAKLVVLSGIFTFQPSLPVDLLVVGEDIGRGRFGTILSEIEDLMGLEITYAIMSEDEYEYRRLMNDRFIRDILDYPHMVALNHLKSKKH